jgi:hypothetical protein
MNRTIQSIRMAGLLGAVAGALGCHGLLQVDSPGQIADADLNSPTAVPGLVVGMSNRLTNAMATNGGNMIVYSALVSGEMFHGGSYAWDQDPTGFTTPDDGYLGGSWGAVQVARWVAEAGLVRMYSDSVLGPTAYMTNAYVSRAYLLAALANRTLGEIFCTAVIDGGEAQSSTVYFDRAKGQADSAILIGNAAGSGAANYVKAAYGVRASVKAWEGDWTGAVADAQQVTPATFVVTAVTQTPTPDNNFWFETHSRNEYTVYNTFMSDSLYAVKENMDGPAWRAAHLNDPRAKWKKLLNADGSQKVGQNGYTPAYQQNKYDVQTAPVAMVKATEMLLLRAEAALRQATPDIAGAYTLMNQARAVAPYNMAALAVAPNLATAWKDLHYERAATVWLEARHLWDASRWYNEPASSPAHSEAMAGRDQCLPVSLSEINSNLNLGSYRAGLVHPLKHQ